MKTMKIWRLVFAMLAAFSLASCSSDDDDKDKVEQVTLYVSAETGTYQNVPDNNYVEGMLIKENGAANWECVSFMEITGFTYERGNEYELLVKKTTLVNPPQDSGNVRYELIRIVSQRKIELITPVPIVGASPFVRCSGRQGELFIYLDNPCWYFCMRPSYLPSAMS